MEKWNEICFLIGEHKNNNTKEDFFQLEIEHIFEILGWSRFKKEIITKERTKVGATNSIIPDIIIRNNENNLIVVELKRPNSPIENHCKQLFSYMRLQKVQFGLLIGEKIQFFYETPIDTKPPKLILEIEFIPNNSKGIEFIELFSKEMFNEDKIVKFCNDRLDLIEVEKEKKDIVNYLKSEDGEGYILKLIGDDLYKKYNEEIIDEIISQITINIKTEEEFNSSLNSIQQKTSETTSEKMPIEYFPSNTNEFKTKFLEKGLATLNYHYIDGRIETKIWQRDSFKDTSSLKGNLRSRPEAKKGKWKELGISKLIVKIDN
jgi:hypothetical protein